MSEEVMEIKDSAEPESSKVDHDVVAVELDPQTRANIIEQINHLTMQSEVSSNKDINNTGERDRLDNAMVKTDDDCNDSAPAAPKVKKVSAKKKKTVLKKKRKSKKDVSDEDVPKKRGKKQRDDDDDADWPPRSLPPYRPRSESYRRMYDVPPMSQLSPEFAEPWRRPDVYPPIDYPPFDPWNEDYRRRYML
jgi:hypothetical protein